MIKISKLTKSFGVVAILLFFLCLCAGAASADVGEGNVIWTIGDASITVDDILAGKTVDIPVYLYYSKGGVDEEIFYSVNVAGDKSLIDGYATVTGAPNSRQPFFDMSTLSIPIKLNIGNFAAGSISVDAANNGWDVLRSKFIGAADNPDSKYPGLHFFNYTVSFTPEAAKLASLPINVSYYWPHFAPWDTTGAGDVQVADERVTWRNGTIYIQPPTTVTFTPDPTATMDPAPALAVEKANISVGKTHFTEFGGANPVPAASLVPTAEGYTFLGYYNETNKDSGTAVMVVNSTGYLVTNAAGYVDENGKWINTGEPDYNLTLYGAWVLGYSNLTFNTLGGTCTTAEGKIYFGEDVVKDKATGTTEIPADDLKASKEHHIFGGWNVSGTDITVITNEGNLVSSALPYVKDGKWNWTIDLVLNASWTPMSTILTFDEDGGSPAIGDARITYGEAVTNKTAAELINTAKYGYTLKGWNVTGTGTTLFNESGALMTGDVDIYIKDGMWNYTSADTLGLQAWWGPKVTEITLDNRSANPGATEKVTAVYGDSLTSIIFPTKEGYTFHGYYNSSDDGTTLDTQYYDEGGNGAVSAWNIDAEIYTLYANWTENSYTINFDANSGEGSMDSVTVNYTDSYELPPSSFTPPAGKGFDGWLNGTNVYSSDKLINAGTSVSKLNATDGGSWTFYANWTDGYTVTYSAPEMDVGTTLPTDDKLYLPHWTDEQRTVTVNSTPVTRTGYTLKGWNNSADNHVYTAGQTFVIISSVTLTAEWTPINYTLTLNVNPETKGTVWHNASDLTKVHYKDVIQINATNATGYHFVNWTNATGLYSADNLTTIEMPADNVILTANFAPNVYNVSFDPNGGTGDMAQQQFKYDAAQSLTPVNFTKNGYSFAGWNKTDGTGTTVDYADAASVKNLADANESTVRLYAVWKVIEYTITYNLADNFVNNSANQVTSYNITSPEITLKPAVRSGYDFDHWYNSAEKTVPVSSIPQGSFGDVELYDNWTLIEKTNTTDGSGTIVPTEYIFSRVSETFPSNHYGWVKKVENLTSGTPVTFKAYNDTVSDPSKSGYYTYIYGKFSFDAEVVPGDKAKVTIQLDNLESGHAITDVKVLHYVDGGWKEMTILSREGLTIIAETETFCPMAVVVQKAIPAAPEHSSSSSRNDGYSVWLQSPSSHYVNFNMMGHGTQIVNQTVAHGSAAVEPMPAPTAGDAYFGGWYTDADCTFKYDFTTPVTSTVTLYAKWTNMPTAGQVPAQTPASPVPFAGILAGLGAAGVLFTLRRK